MEEQKKDTMKVDKPPRKSSIALPIISVEETPSACSLVWPSSSQPINENDEEAEDNSQFCKKEDDEKTSSGFAVGEEDEMKNGLSGSTLQSDQSNMVLKRRMTFATSGSVSSSTFTSIRRTLSEETQLDAKRAEELEQRLKNLVAAFSNRTRKAKAKIKQPPTPSSSESEGDESTAGEANLLERLKSLSSPNGSSPFGEGRRKSISEKVRGSCVKKLRHFMSVLTCNYILDADGTFYISWLVVVSLCFLYNAWVIPLRAIFPYQTKDNLYIWMALDAFADVVYLFDVIAFKSHRKFLAEGFWIKVPNEARRSYFKTLQFKIDLVALFPADIISSLAYKNFPLLRIPRILKIETFWELFQRFDTILASPHSARIARTCIYMLYMIHTNACAYYGLSTLEGIGTTTWTFDGKGNAYIRCFYFATKTATSIGKNPRPENEMEYLYMTFSWLSGVFVFAILIGQIRDIIATATKNQEEYRAMTYAAISYLHRLGVPKTLQSRVQLWLSYTWEQQKTLDESKILDLLPNKMRSDVALDLHVDTLSKVKLFQNCEVAFLRDLVVKLRSIIFLPGDYVCRKGEVGREMFIVKSGKIHVVGGTSGSQILATLGEGSVFGEIALLGIGGMNKRTADVRAAGFANLFVLSKDGLDDAIRDYPSSQEIMRKKAKKLMKENIKKARAASAAAAALQNKDSSDVLSSRGSRDDAVSSEVGDQVIIKNKPDPPKLLAAMMQIFPPDSKIGRYLAMGSKAVSETDLYEQSLDNFTSYPPTPYLPLSPGHMSPELDISIMSGDSLEKQLSPKPLSRLSLHMNKCQQASTGSNSKGNNNNLCRLTLKSESVSSGEELKAYLDDYDDQMSLPVDDADESNPPRCCAPQPPKSDGEEEEEKEVDEDGNNSGLNIIHVTQQKDLVTNVSSSGGSSGYKANNNLPRSTRRRSSSSSLKTPPMTFYECQDETTSRRVKMMTDEDNNSLETSVNTRPLPQPPQPSCGMMMGGCSSSSSTNISSSRAIPIDKFVDREVIPLLLRPPKYPIEFGAYPGVSLSSSEESEDHEEGSLSNNINKVSGGATQRVIIKKDMTPQKAAIIASRFLTVMSNSRQRAQLRRQHSVNAPDVESQSEEVVEANRNNNNNNNDMDESFDYDTE